MEKINEDARKQIREYFRQLNVLFLVFIAGIILFLATGYIVVDFQKPLNPEYAEFLLFGAPLSGVALILLGYRLFLGRVKNAQTREKLFEKMEGYRSAMVLRLILLDGAAFVQIIAYIMTGERVYLFLCLGVVTVFFLVKPRVERFIQEMKLGEVEAKVMRDHYYK